MMGKPKYPLFLFETGRKVRCIETASTNRYINGKVYVSKGLKKSIFGNKLMVLTTTDEEGNLDNGYYILNFEPVFETEAERILFGDRNE